MSDISVKQSEQVDKIGSWSTAKDDDVTLRVCTIGIENLRIQFFTHSKKLHQWISSYYELCDSEESENPANTYSIRLEEIGSTHALKLPDTSPGLFTKFCLISDTHCYFAGGLFTSQAADDTVHHIIVDAAAGTAYGNIGGIFLQSEESFIYVVLRAILRRLALPLSGYLMLHGSVVTRGHQTIFFAGDKGMGKSTIALEMLKHGYKIISDDSPIAALTADGIYIFSGRDQLSVTDNTITLFPELRQCVLRRRDVSGKYFLDRKELGDISISTAGKRITHYIQLKRGSYERPLLNPTNKGIATANLIREFMPIFRKELAIDQRPNLFRNTHQKMFQILSDLLSGAVTYELLYSDSQRCEVPLLISALD